MNFKLPKIECGRGNALPHMTSAQRKRANALIRKTCCNYDDGNCLPLGGVCPQTISASVCCKWFRWAVLPQDKSLEAEIFQSSSVKRCDECGKAFVPGSNRARYCPACAPKVRRRQKNANDRKHRRTNRD